MPIAAGPGWPLDKSLTGIPTLYAWSLAYGRNLLTGQPSPAGRWRIRNLKPWIRSNPPVGALGDKERPATSYITVACTGRDRWFDLDAVRIAGVNMHQNPATRGSGGRGRLGTDGQQSEMIAGTNPGGAPPLDWWHHVDAIIDTEIDRMSKVDNRASQDVATRTHGVFKAGEEGQPRQRYTLGAHSSGARGVQIRRALERAGILTTLDAYDISPRGYNGAHYAVWPPELVQRLINEMCPRRVCTQCGKPSRRIVGEVEYRKPDGRPHEFRGDGFETNESLANRRKVTGHDNGNMTAIRPTVGWSACGCNSDFCGCCGRQNITQTDLWCQACLEGHVKTATRQLENATYFAQHDKSCPFEDVPVPPKWRPGRILDPFVGSGTTLAVASGMGRDSIGIDLDPRSADLARDRVGLFLEVDHGTQETVA